MSTICRLLVDDLGRFDSSFFGCGMTVDGYVAAYAVRNGVSRQGGVFAVCEEVLECAPQ